MPHSWLKVIQEIIENDTGWDVLIQPDVLEDAEYDFGWDAEKIKKCILKLNDWPHAEDKDKNHFDKATPHRRFPDTMVFSYRARDIMDGYSVYTHLYIHPDTGMVVINSFKEL
jgi:hypothetical protein